MEKYRKSIAGTLTPALSRRESERMLKLQLMKLKP
jgi:hypothetical protein